MNSGKKFSKIDISRGKAGLTAEFSRVTAPILFWDAESEAQLSHSFRSPGEVYLTRWHTTGRQSAGRGVYFADDRLPLGRIVTAMTMWFEDNLKWKDIRDEICAALAREAQECRVRDRERKRAAKRRT